MSIPQLAMQAEIRDLGPYIEDDTWVLEQKLDGHRVMLCSPGGNMKPTALTRGGNLYSRRMPKEIDAFRFPAGNWVLDGEFVDGTYWVFDLPVSPATKADSPLELRRVVLESLLTALEKRSGHPFRLVPQARTRQEKIKLAETALINDYEGLVLKDRRSAYVPGGRVPAWTKVKFTSSADVVVTDVRGDGKESVGYGVTKADGSWWDLGRASLIGKEKAGAISVGDVVEVKYLYVGANKRLYQPTLVQRRTDKQPHECDDQQFRFVNKSVLASL